MFWMRGTGSKAPRPLARRQQLVSLVACALALLLVGSATLTRPWHALEFKTFDMLTALAAPYRTTLPVVILAIDEPTFQELQHPWPFPRSLHAQLLRRLKEDGAVAVGLDVVFADPSSDAEDAALARAIADTSPV
ncbi:MAG: CHASE2 domain-containing protein, partial [Gammaproteobacteria bacterium]|nr:CHASE2 domain-containing protein [Gammaproteobacteria bacterium]